MNVSRWGGGCFLWGREGEGGRAALPSPPVMGMGAVFEVGRERGGKLFPAQWGWGWVTLCLAAGEEPSVGVAAPASSTDHRQSSRHIHHPLSAHLPSEGRRKKGSQSKKKKKAPRARASVAGETPTIEEEAEVGQEEEGEDDTCDTETEPTPEELLPNSSPEGVQVGADREGGRGECRNLELTLPLELPVLPAGG